MSAPPPPPELLVLLSSLRAQLLASEAEVARLRAENARLRHESLQRAFVHVANGNNVVPVPAGTAAAAASAARLRASSIAGVSALCSLKRPSSSDRIAGADIANDNNSAAAASTAVAAAPAPAPGQQGGSLCLIPGCSEPSEGERSSHLCRGHHGQLGPPPYTNNLPWMLDAAWALHPRTLSYDSYDVPVSLALAGAWSSVHPNLMCAVNGLVHGTNTTTPATLKATMKAHRAVGCDSILLFGGTQPIDTPGFETPSLVNPDGTPTAFVAAVRAGAA